MKKVFLLVSLLLFFSSCQVAERLAIVNCKYSFLNIVPERIGITSLDLKLTIQVDNPNPVTVTLDKLGFDFFVNDSRVFTGEMRNRLTVSTGGTAIIEHIVRLSYLRTGIAIVRAIKRKEAYYFLRGRATYNTKFGRFTFPVRITLGKNKKIIMFTS